MSTPVGIAASGITHCYGDQVAVDSVTFEVATGEVFGLLGPNGAGKTTILRALAGVLVPTRGQATIMGVALSADPLRAKRLLGFLSGDTALYGRLSVRELLTYFGQLNGLAKTAILGRIDALSQELALSQFLDVRVAALSTGQRQRANLARAFLTDPPALILDEPTTGLDVISGAFVFEAIEQARQRGKAVLFSTHIMSEVERLCDRIGVLISGRLVTTGTLAQVLTEGAAPDLTALIMKLHHAGREPLL